VLPGGMGRLSLAIVAVLLVGCDEEDPATSEHCVMTRMRVIDLRFWREQRASGGFASASSLAADDAAIARLMSTNWECFK
jgi:hypothetical protein